jgi:hypothetical protein
MILKRPSNESIKKKDLERDQVASLTEEQLKNKYPMLFYKANEDYPHNAYAQQMYTRIEYIISYIEGMI